MKRLHFQASASIVWLAAILTAHVDAVDPPIRVVLEQVDGEFRLTRGGKPYVIHGVGGHDHLAMLAASGGNSIRTWSTDGIDKILDEAHQNGLTVCVGLWIGHERHGFDYQNETAVTKQLREALQAVEKYKDHPAVLMWGIGNEMEGAGTNPAIWYAIDHIARETKRIDPNHPTMTVIAELGDHKLDSIERFCPHIDIVGVNSYGGITSLPTRYRESGGTKPYVITEHGPHGPWEVDKTAWDSAIEATSTAKGKGYADGHRIAVASQQGLCLGSYAFLWGTKQETTATWFGMLLPDGSRLAAADAMTEAWTGTAPANRCPEIESLEVDKSSGLKPGAIVNAKLVVKDPENDKVETQWILRHDSGVVGTGGDAQADESAIPNAVVGDQRSATITMPKGGGGYRLFAYARDGKGGAAVANVPLYVDAPIHATPAPKAKLPYAVYDDTPQKSPFTPSGYMGNATAIEMTLDSKESPHAGQTCLKIRYTATDQWGGVLWQSPPDDWDGKKPGGLNLTGASALEFWGRGANGGEQVNFVMGVIDGPQLYRDTAKAELPDVRLTKQWQKFRIPLNGKDLSRIKTAFGWSLAGQGKAVEFFIDEIKYVSE